MTSDGGMSSLSEEDLIKIVMGNGAPHFKDKGLTIEQLRDIVLGGPNNFAIMRNSVIEEPQLDGGMYFIF